MTIALPGAPFLVTYRELWLPPSVNGNAILPSSIEGGYPLTLTGARKGTSTDGVRSYGTVNDHISCGALYNASAKLWVSLRFRIDNGWTPGSGIQYLWGKRFDGNNRTVLCFDTADAKLYWAKYTIGVSDFRIAAQNGGGDITTWVKGQWYHVLASISSVNGVRFIVNAGPVVTDADVSAVTNGGDVVISNQRSDGAGGVEAFKGTIADVFMGNDDLSQAAPDEETDLYNGIPPSDAVNAYLLDEGRGLGAVVIDRGTGGNNGTIASNPAWAYGQVEQPVLSLDGINDRGVSSAGVDISGDITLVWAGKMKSTYDALAAYHYLAQLRVDGNNQVALWHTGATSLRFFATGGGVGNSIYHPQAFTIDEYSILICTLTLSGVMKFFVNGSLTGTETGVGVIAGAAIAHIGVDVTPLYYDVSKPLMVALIDGAFTQKQARTYSRYLKNVFNLPITV